MQIVCVNSNFIKKLFKGNQYSMSEIEIMSYIKDRTVFYDSHSDLANIKSALEG